MTTCQIYLENNENGVYRAGQLLRGSIALHLEERKRINGLFFIVYGFSYCHWTESESVTVGTGDDQRSETRTVTYDAKDVYINTKTYLFGASGASATEMASGIHRFDFACQLPDLLPASFEASLGHIRYNVEAVLDIPWKFDKKFIVQFTVVRHDNLNDFPDLKLACHSEEIKTFCCCCCKSQPLVMTVTLPYTGYAPGQIIHTTVEYKNRSGIVVERTKIKLQRVIRFNSTSPSRSSKFEYDKMAEVNCDGAQGKDIKTIQKAIAIPQIAVASNKRYCNVVQIYYELVVEAKVPGCRKNVVMIIPITIGAVPLRFGDAFSNAELPSAYVPHPSAPISDPPPPSFDEAVGMKKTPNEFSSFGQGSSSLGWNVAEAQAPSAPTKS